MFQYVQVTGDAPLTSPVPSRYDATTAVVVWLYIVLVGVLLTKPRVLMETVQEMSVITVIPPSLVSAFIADPTTFAGVTGVVVITVLINVEYSLRLDQFISSQQEPLTWFHIMNLSGVFTTRMVCVAVPPSITAFVLTAADRDQVLFLNRGTYGRYVTSCSS